MDPFIKIYKSQAVEYQRMIAAEDSDENLPSTIRGLTDLHGKTMVDLGTGTGRLPVLFAGEADRTIALDLHFDMLKEGQRIRDKDQGKWALTMADMRYCPLPANFADLVMAGWSIGHFCGWYPQTWKQEITRVIDEMHRLVRPAGGVLIILETLSTGSLIPQPPNDALAAYYQWIENVYGFQRIEIQTDYQFSSVEEAVQLTEFFFGGELADKIRMNRWSRLPEWTGIWVKRL